MQTEDRTCKTHGVTTWGLENSGCWRCLKCRTMHVQGCRQRRKKYLVDHYGGKCVICGYNKCLAALEFHHVDPLTKKFGISEKGFTRSKEIVLAEADKCVLVCSNCHQEIEAGVTPCPKPCL